MQALLPQATFEAWDRQFEAVRAIKTPQEAALMKRNADLMDDAFLETFESIRVGEKRRKRSRTA